MAVLSANAKRIVNHAVHLMPGDRERAIWDRWASQADNGVIPHVIHAIAVTALDRRLSEIERLRETAEEDDQSCLDNDASFIVAIKRTLAD